MTRRVALFASTTADISGGLLAACLGQLLARGWDARLFCTGKRWLDELALCDERLRRRIEVVPKTTRRSTPFDRDVRHFELVHFHSGWAAWRLLRRGRLGAARVAISLREDGQDLALPDPPFVWERAQLLLFGAQHARDRAVARGWPRERSAVLRTPILAAGVNRAAPAEPGRLRILSAGPLIWEQGFEHSVHAVRLLIDAGVRCSYRIIGEGDHLMAIAFARHQLGLSEHVELIRPADADLAQALGSADVFVDPAVTDTVSPGALQAAHAVGLPIVVTQGRGTPVARSAIQVPRRDPRAIADALRLAAADRGSAPTAEQIQRLLALNLDDYVNHLEIHYRDVLGAVS
jgi:glycosyltransferase involved in cell wall biosynthesis